MTVLDDVHALIRRLAPAAICDDCIATKLGLPQRQQANQKSRELTGTDGFERRRDICSLCLAEKIVIRQQPR